MRRTANLFVCAALAAAVFVSFLGIGRGFASPANAQEADIAVFLNVLCAARCPDAGGVQLAVPACVPDESFFDPYEPIFDPCEMVRFDVCLEEVGPNKMQVIKVIKEIVGIGLKEAKELVDSAPKVLVCCVSEEVANKIKAKLENAGAEVKLVPKPR